MGRHCEGRGRDGEREFPGAHAEDLHRQRALVSGPIAFWFIVQLLCPFVAVFCLLSFLRLSLSSSSFSSFLLVLVHPLHEEEANSSAASDTHVQLDRAAVKGFNLVSPFLPPETREKITMLGSGDFLPELLEWCEVRGRALIQPCQEGSLLAGRHLRISLLAGDLLFSSGGRFGYGGENII